MKIKISMYDYENLIFFRKDLSTAQYTMDAFKVLGDEAHAVQIGTDYENNRAAWNHDERSKVAEKYILRDQRELIDMVYEVVE